MAITLNGTTGITTPALDSEGNLEYSGTLTGGTGVINIGSGQVVKDASGRVGIGTSSPATNLTVGNASGANGIAITQRSDISTTSGMLFLSDSVGSTSLRTVSGNLVVSTGATIGSSSGTERARIDASGNFLLGATSSSNIGIPSLEVGGSNGNGVITVRRSVTTTAGHVLFINPNGQVGLISTTGTSTSYGTSSDYRLKENVAPMQNALATVAQLNPVTYNWKVDGSAGQGFIAHELQAVVPDCVTGEKDEVRTVDVHDEEGKVIGTKEEPQYQGVDTSFLVGILTAAIKEQQTLIQALTARIEALEVA